MAQLPIIERAARFATRTAVREGTVETSYSDLIRRTNAISSALLGTKRDLSEGRVAFLVPPGVDYISTQWGIWQAGGVAVPLSLSAAEPELHYALTDSEASQVVASESLQGSVADLCDQLETPLSIVEQTDDTAPRDLPSVDRERRAMILYTSGTTSKPKGVVSTHANVQAQIETLIEAWQWQPDDAIPLFLPLHHIHGIINVLSCALWSGATVEPFPHFEPRSVLDRVAAKAYSVFMAVPTIYVKLIEALESLPDQDREKVTDGFRAMRLMVSGSAALPVTVHEKWSALTGQVLLERYGMTEIGMALSNPYDGERRPGAVGLPLPGGRVRLVGESGTVVTEAGQPGEIQVRGPSVFREYWNRPDATSKAFTGEWFQTGDIAVVEDGYYRIMGRQSVDIIKSGGYKLSALEIEAVLLEHAEIAQCAVVGVPDDTWGEAVAAAIVSRTGASLDMASLQSWCRDRMSHYKVPRRLEVVTDLPRNAMGKVMKPAVRDLF